MSSRVVFDMAAFKHKLSKASRKAENAVADQIIADCRQYVPKQENTLRDSARIEHDGGGTQVTYNTPYAAYIEAQNVATKASIEAVKKLSEDVGIPTVCEEIREADLDSLASDALKDACYPGNPREATHEQVVELFRKIM